MARPVPPEPLHGYHYEASAEPERTLEWRLASGKPCRSGRPSCKRPCVAELNRGVHLRTGHWDRWWAYCERHLYGRWVEDGQIMHWRLAEDGSDG